MAKKVDEEIEEGPRSFAVLLGQLENGGLVGRISSELQVLNAELLDLAQASHGIVKGSLTLKLDISVEHNGVVAIKAAVDTKSPKVAGGTSVLWMTKGHNLTVQNPRQLELPVRSVDEPERRELDEDDNEEARSV